jgi:hypothetical protein
MPKASDFTPMQKIYKLKETMWKLKEVAMQYVLMIFCTIGKI